MEYIKLKDAIDKFERSGATLDKEQILYLIGRIPVTEIVTCSECKYLEIRGFDQDAFCRERTYPLTIGGFCERGEKNETD